MVKHTVTGSLALAAAFAAVMLSCSRPTDPPNANTPPHTRVANIPKDSATVFALATLYWDGGDDDGYIVGYQYRYTTYHRSVVDGSWTQFAVTAWKDTTGSSVTIPFNSTDSLNLQVFEVRAIDNNGNVDPNPARKILYTTRTAPPISRVLYPAKNSTVLAANQTTDWWHGVNLAFLAHDQAPQGGIVEYAWQVDGGAWHWTADTSVFVLPSDFTPPISGKHVFKVISRNTTNLVDPTGDSAVVSVVVPSFAKQLLIIHETDERNAPFGAMKITTAQVDSFYNVIFPGADVWNFVQQGMPPREVLANYQLLVWHADDIPVSNPHKISLDANIQVFTDYLKVGGKFMMSGWRILKSFNYKAGSPYTFAPGSFVYDYLHIYTGDETIDYIGDCIGGEGKSGFPSFAVDSVKLGKQFGGMLNSVDLITKTAGFTEGLYNYVNRNDSQFPKYRGRAIAVRYYGTVYDAIVLGFPLYFVNIDDAKAMAQQILRSLNVH
jgi:hypothetical protein